MSLQTGTARTGFNNLLPPRFLRAQSEPGFDTTTTPLPADHYSGTLVAVDRVPGISNGVLIAPSAPADPRTIQEWEWWGTPQGYILGTSDEYWNLIDASFVDEGILRFDMVSASVWPRESRKLVLVEYSLQAPAATGFLMNTALSYVTDATKLNSLPTCNLHDETSEALTSAIDRVFGLAGLVEFEDGIENEFTMQLKSLVKRWGGPAVAKLASTIFCPEVRTEIAAQTLLCLGRIDDKGSYSARSRILREGLRSASAKVRDAAAVGIASILDCGAKADLATAIEKEPVPSLKEDMRAVLGHLRTAK